jgi:hypothetical protein
MGECDIGGDKGSAPADVSDKRLEQALKEEPDATLKGESSIHQE